MKQLEEKILELFEQGVKNRTIDDIYQELNETYKKEAIQEVVTNLEKKGKIYRNKKDQFQIWHNGLGRIFGTIRITAKGAGVLKEESGKITFIHRQFLNGALNGDKAIVNEIQNNGKRQEGKVERIVDRMQSTILCEITNTNVVKRLKPLSENEDIKIKVDKEDLNKYIDGDRLLVKLELEKDNQAYIGRISKKICHKDDPNSDLITIAAAHGFEYDFPSEVKEEAKKMPRDISQEDISNRVDLRDKIIFTIDGEDTKDIDDAISLEILPNGNYKLGVHIADVSHYVKPGSAIFKEALKRGTSLYMLSSVIPMLPRELSNGICSLNPNEDRLAKTCEMEIDKNGNIIKSKIFDSVIRSNKKMSYTAVNEILENGNIPEGYEEYSDILKEMHYLSQQMDNKKLIRGAVEFDRPEMKIKTDIKGRLYDIQILRQKSAETLIENFMLAANESVATIVSKKGLPFMYRVHNYPNIDKLNEITEIISDNNSEISKPSAPFTSSKVVQTYLKTLSKLKEYPAYSTMILKAMSKAEYSSTNIGHYGLALSKYTHFTSPIRRFPDLIVHHLLNLYQKENIDNLDLKDLQATIESMALHSSEREQAAQKAEYAANSMKTSEYLADYIGEEFSGIVTDITDRGMSVQLDNLIEGYINISDIEPKSFYKFFRSKRMLISEDNSYRLGDNINLRLKSSNKKQRRINFVTTGHTDNKNHKIKLDEKPKTKKIGYRQNKKNSV